MLEGYRDIYEVCRESAGFIQGAVAERLGISVENLRVCETDQRMLPDEVVETMSDLYNALHLIARHVHERNAVYNRAVPEVPQCPVLEASTKLTNQIYTFADSHADRRPMQMAEDSVIDAVERPEFDAIMEGLQDIVKVTMAVCYARRGRIGKEGVDRWLD